MGMWTQNWKYSRLIILMSLRKCKFEMRTSKMIQTAHISKQTSGASKQIDSESTNKPTEWLTDWLNGQLTDWLTGKLLPYKQKICPCWSLIVEGSSEQLFKHEALEDLLDDCSTGLGDTRSSDRFAQFVAI